jgi:hypothetical protein
MKSLSFIAFLVGGTSAFSAGIQLPATASSQSPDHRWKLTCKYPAQGAADLRPSLLLTRVGGRTVELRRIDRNCEIFWSPDSAMFALTDNWASDQSDVLIYWASGRASIKSLAKLFPTNALPKEELQGHCYFQARQWLDRHRLRIEVSGHTDYPPPVYSFEHEYIFDFTSATFEKAVKKRPNKINGAKASGSHEVMIRKPWSARIAQCLR